MTLSNSQITKLGDRLRKGTLSEEDLSLLDAFRQTFNDIDEHIYPMIHSTLNVRPECTLTKRKRKTQQSIVDKLRRQPKLRLPQMQDIAGCRIVVQDGSLTVQQINDLLSHTLASQPWSVENKSRQAHGYRAIHIVVKASKKFYEIQLRTYAQDIWANLVERQCDENNTLKYGGTEQEQHLMDKLKSLSDRFCAIDQQAHESSFTQYEQQIGEAIKHVLSH
jgi:ppGpp synthetase/RelA/SpoT-type nucleotidyltranferase